MYKTFTLQDPGFLGGFKSQELLLDVYPAYVAYSVRKLSSSYNGAALRIRRDSDNAEKDIGFVDGDLDTADIASFCAGTTGHVKIWYDQSGNNRDYEQTTTGAQPLIFFDSSVETVSGVGAAKPAIKFDGSNHFLEQPFENFTGITAATVYSVNKTITAGGGFWAYNDDFGGISHHPWVDGFIYEGFFSSTRQSVASGGLLTSQHLYTVMSKTSGFNIGVNGNSIFSTGTNTFYLPSVYFIPIKIGISTINQFYYNGFYQEHIIYSSDNLSDSAAISNNINTYFSIYA
jgi:hypothetical protein